MKADIDKESSQDAAIAYVLIYYLCDTLCTAGRQLSRCSQTALRLHLQTGVFFRNTAGYPLLQGCNEPLILFDVLFCPCLQERPSPMGMSYRIVIFDCGLRDPHLRTIQIGTRSCFSIPSPSKAQKFAEAMKFYTSLVPGNSESLFCAWI